MPSHYGQGLVPSTMEAITGGFAPGPDYKSDQDKYGESDLRIRAAGKDPKKLSEAAKQHPDNPNNQPVIADQEEEIDITTGWPTFLMKPEETYNNNIFQADEITPKSLLGIRYDRPARNDSVPATQPRWLEIHENFYKDGSPAYENTWTGEISPTYAGLNLLGDNTLASIRENAVKYWDWMDEQPWGPPVKETLKHNGLVDAAQYAGDTFEYWNEEKDLNPAGYTFLKILEGIDAAFTFGGNTINHFFPVNSHYAKGTLEVAEFLAPFGGAGKINNLDDIKWLKAFDGFATELPTGRWLTADGIEFSDGLAAKTYFAIKNSGGVTPTPREAVKYLKSNRVGFSTKVSGFSVSSAFKSEESLNSLKEFIESANKYREGSLKLGDRRHLMGGFKFNGQPFIVDDNGAKWILKRSSNADKVKLYPKVTDNAHYKLVPLKHVEQQIINKSIQGADAKNLVQLKKDLRAFMKGLRETNPDQYFDRIIRYSDYPYIEHRVAKGLDWFWDGDWRKGANVDWAGPSRGDAHNLRMLFSEPYKTTKDKIELILKNGYQNVGYNKNQGKWLVLDIADPLDGRIISRRSNPGDLVIRRAAGGEVIGRISDIYAELYSPNFKEIFNKHGHQFSNAASYGVNFKRKRLPNGKLENITQYRTRVLRERVGFIVAEADSGRNLHLNGTIDPAKITQAQIKDINAMHRAISIVGPNGIRQSLLEVPDHVNKFMGKNWYFHVGDKYDGN